MIAGALCAAGAGVGGRRGGAGRRRRRLGAPRIHRLSSECRLVCASARLSRRSARVGSGRGARRSRQARLPGLRPAAAGARRGRACGVVSQSDAGRDRRAGRAARASARVPELDDELELSARFDPDAVPARACCSTAARSATASRGCTRARLAELAARRRASTLDARRAARAPARAARRARATRTSPRGSPPARARARRPPPRARRSTIGGLEDPIEALHDRGADRRPAGRAADARARRRDARGHEPRPAGGRRRACRPTTARRPSRRSRSTR